MRGLPSCGSDKLVLNPATKPAPNATPGAAVASTPLQNGSAAGSQATPTPTRAPQPTLNTSDAGDAWATPTGVPATGSALRRSTVPLSTPASARAHVLGAASVGMADGAAFARIAHAFVCRPLDPYTPPCHACRHLVAADSKTRMSTCSKAVCCATFCRRCASKLNTKPSRTAGCPKCSVRATRSLVPAVAALAHAVLCVWLVLRGAGSVHVPRMPGGGGDSVCCQPYTWASPCGCGRCLCCAFLGRTSTPGRRCLLRVKR